MTHCRRGNTAALEGCHAATAQPDAWGEGPGEQGHVDDLLINPKTWTHEWLLVDTSNWIGGRWEIPTHAVRGVDWGTRSFDLGLTQKAVLDSREVPAGEHPPCGAVPTGGQGSRF